MDERGNWNPKREDAFINNFVLEILVYARCNHDAKLLTNGDGTMKVAWYISKYTTKQQQKCSNPSALLAEGLAFHYSEDKYVNNLRKRSQLLLFRSYHSINRHSEQLAPQVISYLMGWGDSILSHQYVPLYWSLMVRYLVCMYPEFQHSRK